MAALPSNVPVGIVGAGTMGAGIAQVALLAGHPVRLLDADAGAARAAVQAITARLAREVEKGRLGDAVAQAARQLLQVAGPVADLADCGLVVEAILEDLPAKRALFSDLEKTCARDALLASNTSSISITDIAAGLSHPGRVAGLHFFNPAPLLPLVEVVAGAATTETTVDTLAATAGAWGKTPVRAASTPGFIVNRVARPFYAEAFRILAAETADAATIDALIRESGGFRMGPCELTDLIGQDINSSVTRSVWEAFGRDPRFEPSAVQEQLVADGRLGRKTGQGFYLHGDPRPEPSTAVPRGTRRGWRHSGAGGPRMEPSAASAASALGAPTVADRPEPTSGWQIECDDVVVRLTDGRPAAAHTDEAGRTVILVDLALDFAAASRIGITAPPDAPSEHVDAVVTLLDDARYAVTVLPDTPGLVVARTVAMLAAFAAEATQAGVATAQDIDTAMRLGANYPRGPYQWGDALGWSWVSGVLSALAATEDPERYRMPHLPH